MKRTILVLLVLVFSYNGYSQISFEKGYYINNNNERIECFIKNKDWINNPIKFEYHLSDTKTIKEASINSIKEFGIYSQSKYIRSTVNIDRSSEDLNELSTSKSPVFNEEQLFLKILVEGKANLYSFRDRRLIRFFYKKASNIEQLVFKSFLIDDTNIGKNKEYQRQLWKDLKCQSISIKDIEKIDYEENELVNFFEEYNNCGNSEITNIEDDKQKKLFNLNVRVGLTNSSLDLKYGNENSSQEFDSQSELEFRFGIETEYILPFNKNKWAILLEPTYQYLKYNKIMYEQNVSVDYKSIEIPIGFRHYFFLNNKSKIFINASYVIDITSDSKIDFENGTDVKIEGSNYFAVGLGYKYDAKYIVEMRYGLSRDISENNPSWISDLNTLSFILGYTIF